MRVIVTVIYVVMAAWLLVAAGIRIALVLQQGLPLDPLPFISGAIAVTALLVLFPANAELRQRRDTAQRTPDRTTEPRKRTW